MFLLVCALWPRADQADRAFGAQHSSGGRTGWRFAPPSGGAALRAALGAPSAPQFQKVHFEQFGALGPDIARMHVRRLILSSLTAWAQIWPDLASESLFRVLWRPGPRYGQNGPQEAHFEHFGGMGPDMARMGLRRLILSTLAAWAQIWPEWASEGSF